MAQAHEPQAQGFFWVRAEARAIREGLRIATRRV